MNDINKRIEKEKETRAAKEYQLIKKSKIVGPEDVVLNAKALPERQKQSLTHRHVLLACLPFGWFRPWFVDNPIVHWTLKS